MIRVYVTYMYPSQCLPQLFFWLALGDVSRSGFWLCSGHEQPAVAQLLAGLLRGPAARAFPELKALTGSSWQLRGGCLLLLMKR